MCPAKPSTILDLNKDERSLLLYFETCMVDGYGKVEAIRMNTGEYSIARKWDKSGFIRFGELKSNPSIYTHYVRFSKKAWTLAHKLRKARSERIISKENVRLLREMAEPIDDNEKVVFT